MLAIGANRMAKKNAIIREFTATETAGSLNVVLTDKTGTITRGILTVKKIFIPGFREYDITGEGYEMQGDIKSEGSKVAFSENDLLAKSIIIAGNCNTASIEEKNEDKDKMPEVSGDPTEAAMLVLSEKTNLHREAPYKDIEVIDDLPFNSEQKFRASLVSYPDEHREMLFLGAPEKIHELSNQSMRVIG